MKIILSRKGFDSGTGGVPSPILPDGSMASLPIPGGAQLSYDDLKSPLGGTMGQWVRELTRGRMTGAEPAHLDPDLWDGALTRPDGWRPSLGQTGAAQSHLQAQGVGIGDVFLFFGWFRPAAIQADGARFERGAPDLHAVFGYLQVGESVLLGADPDPAKVLAERPWLAGHPHVEGHRQANNTLHVASRTLVLDGQDTGLPGAASFCRHVPELTLTAQDAHKSLWRLPGWMHPAADRPSLSYHANPDRWRRQDGHALLQSVAKGQEFVFDAEGLPQAAEWLEGLVRAGLSPAPARRPGPRR